MASYKHGNFRDLFILYAKWLLFFIFVTNLLPKCLTSCRLASSQIISTTTVAGIIIIHYSEHTKRKIYLLSVCHNIRILCEAIIIMCKYLEGIKYRKSVSIILYYTQMAQMVVTSS